jgi:hypothetical protein
VALVALFFALGGTSYAAATYINGSQIKPHSIAKNRLTNSAIAYVAASPVSLATGADGLGIVAYRDTSLALKIAHLSNPLGIPYFRRR